EQPVLLKITNSRHTSPSECMAADCYEALFPNILASLLDCFILSSPSDVAPVNEDERRAYTRSTIGLASNLDLRAWRQLLKLGNCGLHLHMPALVTDPDIILSHR